MNLIKISIKRIVDGALFGIGFGLTVGVVYFVVSEKMSESMLQSMWNEPGLEKVVVTAQEEVKRDDATYILGTVENQGPESVRMSTVQADLFDSAGKFVDQCSEHMSSALRAGAVRNFKINCGNKDKPVADHASYKVRVVGM